MVIDFSRRGCLLDTRKKPEKVIDGTRFKEVTSLEQIKSHLDMFLLDTLLTTKQIKSSADYKSPFKVKEI